MSGRLEDDDPSGYSHSYLMFVESVFVDVQCKTNVSYHWNLLHTFLLDIPSV